ncbi:MAG: radical SAM protein [Bacteroidales bacterium]
MSLRAEIIDKKNLLRSLTPGRLWNALRLHAGYYFGTLTKKPVTWGLPVSMSIEPTTSCNLRCPECPSGLRKFSRDTGMLSFEFYRNFIEEAERHLIYLTLYFQGEPFLNPSFFDIVEDATRRRIYTATSTNAHFLTPENARKVVKSGLKRLIISLDGIGQEIYARYRVGGRYERVIQGIENLLAARKEQKAHSPMIILQFIVFRTNQQQIPEVRRLARKLGVDKLELKSAQVYDYEDGHPLIPTIDRYSRYRKREDGKWEIKNDFKNKCYRMSVSCVMTWDGWVVPCCFDKDAEYRMGSLKQNPMEKIWKGEPYRNFRKRILTSRKSIDICRNCTEGMKL